jgi:hypothetical protein
VRSCFLNNSGNVMSWKTVTTTTIPGVTQPCIASESELHLCTLYQRGALFLWSVCLTTKHKIPGSGLSRNHTKKNFKGLATDWTVHGSSPDEGEIFRSQPTIQWLPGLFAGVKRPGRAVNHPPHLAPRLKKK